MLSTWCVLTSAILASKVSIAFLKYNKCNPSARTVQCCIMDSSFHGYSNCDMHHLYPWGGNVWPKIKSPCRGPYHTGAIIIWLTWHLAVVHHDLPFPASSHQLERLIEYSTCNAWGSCDCHMTQTHHFPIFIYFSISLSQGFLKVIDSQFQTKILFLQLLQLLDIV